MLLKHVNKDGTLVLSSSTYNLNYTALRDFLATG